LREEEVREGDDGREEWKGRTFGGGMKALLVMVRLEF
jgi:hypothetical protein